MAGVFKFKQFAVDQSGCAMKINTDGVLLGALVQAGGATNALDLGTGTGVIALMLAQRFERLTIDALEIDGAAATTAGRNFSASAFASRLQCYPDSFEVFFDSFADRRYDLIVSNPPFYIRSLTSPTAQKNVAKHADGTFFERLITIVASQLADEGKCWLILPQDTATLVKALAAMHSLFIAQLIHVRSYPASEPHLEIIVLSRQQTIVREDQFIIYDEPKRYAAAYVDALRDFFAIF